MALSDREKLMSLEQEYLQTLSGVRNFGFVAGKLVLTSQVDGTVKTLMLERVRDE